MPVPVTHAHSSTSPSHKNTRAAPASSPAPSSTGVEPQHSLVARVRGRNPRGDVPCADVPCADVPCVGPCVNVPVRGLRVPTCRARAPRPRGTSWGAGAPGPLPGHHLRPSGLAGRAASRLPVPVSRGPRSSDYEGGCTSSLMGAVVFLSWNRQGKSCLSREKGSLVPKS